MAVNRAKAHHKQSNLSRVLASSNNRSKVLGRFFENLTAAEIRRAVPQLSSHRHFQSAIQLAEGPNDFYAQRTPDTSLEKNLAWCLGLMEVHQDKIKFFLERQPRILESLLGGQTSVLLELLDEIDNKCGLSIWTIGVRTSALAAENAEAKRAYVAGVIAKITDNPFFKAVAFNATTRLDDVDSLPSEARFFEQKIRRSFTGRILHHLAYRMLPFNPEFDYGYEHIFQIEKDSSPIDIFDCLTNFLIDGVPFGEALYRSTLIDLRRRFSSELLDSLAQAYVLQEVTSPEPEEIRILDLYSAGQYSEVCALFASNDQLALKFPLVEVWVKSLGRCPELLPQREISPIVDALRSIVVKDQNFAKSYGLLLANSYAFWALPWFKELRLFLDNQARFYSPTVNEKMRARGLLISTLNAPAKITAVCKIARVDAAQKLRALWPNSCTANLFAWMHSTQFGDPPAAQLAGIDALRQQKFKAVWYLTRQEYASAVPLLLDLATSNDAQYQLYARAALSEAYLEMGEIERAATVFVDAVSGNENSITDFDSGRLCEAATSIISESKSIAISIALSLHTRHVNDSYGAALKFAFECFLKNNGLADPKEVLTLSNLPEEKVNYFLEHVCTPEVMKLYLYFESSKEIEECRIDICRRLIARQVSTTSMVFEVKDRTRRLVVREATSQVDQSRIYSDVNLLSGASAPTFRALFDRFTALRTMDFSAHDDEKALAEFARLVRIDPRLRSRSHVLHIQNLVLNEKNLLFIKLLKLVRDEFAFSEKGLNVYLSTRIRHGHLPNTLRRPLLENSLLATRATDSGSYRLDSNWAEDLRLPLQSRKSVEHLLMSFSLQINGLVDEINDKWLRLFAIDQDIAGISSDGDMKQSLFNYSVSNAESYILQSLLNDGSSYTDFVAVASRWLWDRTEQNLAAIRTRLTDVVRPRAFELLAELSRAVEQKCGSGQSGDVPDSIARARIGLSQAFDSVRGWFTRARGATISKFELDVPVTIARIAIGTEVDFKDSTALAFDGVFITAFVDIFYNLFENCTSKSGLSKRELWIKASATLTAVGLELEVSNSCFYEPTFRTKNLMLAKHRVDLGAPSQQSIDPSQLGGSGFSKISRALTKDLSLPHSIELGYISEEEFRVHIHVPLQALGKVLKNEAAAR
jgi:hypothetical protein